MSLFDVHTKDTATPKATELLGTAEKAYGFVPNLLGVFAESPAVLEGYMTLGNIFDQSSFTPTERQVVILAASRFNECHYCVAAHSVVAELQKVPSHVIDAIRNDRPIADDRLESLRQFTTKVVEQRGWVSAAEIEAFLAAGFSKAQALEVLLGIAFKTISNYANHLADTPLDDAFAPKRWAAGPKQKAS